MIDLYILFSAIFFIAMIFLAYKEYVFSILYCELIESLKDEGVSTEMIGRMCRGLVDNYTFKFIDKDTITLYIFGEYKMRKLLPNKWCGYHIEVIIAPEDFIEDLLNYE